MANRIVLDCYDFTLALGAWFRVPVIGATDRWARIVRVDELEDGLFRVTADLAHDDMQPLAVLAA